MINAPVAARLSLATFALTALTACGDDRPAATDLTASPTPTATATAVSAATVSQWASLIASHERDWQEEATKVDDDCLDPEKLTACNLGYFGLGLQAELIHVILTGARDNPDSPNYLGEPPAEIRRLIDDTLEAAEQVQDAVEAWQDTDCVDPYADECLGEGFTLRRAVDALTAAYDGWRPYL